MIGMRGIMVLLCLFAAMSGAAAEPAIEPLDHAICRLIESSARANQLPVGFLTRLIWRESSFRAAVVSPAGAEGIAQFMPRTAQERGLADPFDPERAIPKAASLLADLRRQFGNLGVAAAAYNAGPARVLSWLRGEGGLPTETRAYVRYVSGRDVEEWTGPGIANGSRLKTGGAITTMVGGSATRKAMPRFRSASRIVTISSAASATLCWRKTRPALCSTMPSAMA